MPTLTKKQKQTLHKKRHGNHQRRSKQFQKVYLPYLPLIVSVIASLLLSSWSPTRDTLAYATNISAAGLLEQTNAYRLENERPELQLNHRLTRAAQAKANDMTRRNYWSHNTPDGREPWLFIDETGYDYLKAGENLAYGFLTSDETVIGWMNSPTHRDNMLNPEFSEVGFGFANAADFNNSGQQTIVVAMYAQPQALAQAAGPLDNSARPSAAFTSDNQPLEPASQNISRIAAFTGGNAPWAVFAVGLAVGAATSALLIKHGLGLRRLWKKGEDFVLHHPLFDSVVLGIIILGATLLSTVGVIR